MKKVLAAIAATLFVAGLAAGASACPYKGGEEAEKPKESVST